MNLKYKKMMLTFLVLTLMTIPAEASRGQNEPTFANIEKILTGVNFRLGTEGIQRKSEIITTATEEAIQADAQNAVKQMELRYTLNLKTMLVMLTDEGQKSEELQFGNLVLFYTVRHKKDEKFPVDMGISFEFPEGNAVTTKAETLITVEEIEEFLNPTFIEDFAMRFSGKVSSDFAALQGEHAEGFKKVLGKFFFEVSSRMVSQTSLTLRRMLEQYPRAEASILEEASKKYGSDTPAEAVPAPAS